MKCCPRRRRPATAIALAGAMMVSLLAVWGCRSLETAPSALPTRHVLVHEPLIIHSDFELPRQHRLIEELRLQRADLVELLDLPASDEPVHVYLFGTEERYNRFLALHYPEFPSRRAFFVETDTRLTVFAHWGDRVAEDLRHEVAHGYLHAVVPRIPLWLDEGLAEYFEVPRGTRGFNPPHVAELNALLDGGAWRPDLVRLETLESASEMTQTDYAESWAWVHFLLETTEDRRQLLREYLLDLRRQGTAEPLSRRLRATATDPATTLVEHVRGLAAY